MDGLYQDTRWIYSEVRVDKKSLAVLAGVGVGLRDSLKQRHYITTLRLRVCEEKKVEDGDVHKCHIIVKQLHTVRLHSSTGSGRQKHKCFSVDFFIYLLGPYILFSDLHCYCSFFLD